MSIEEPTNVSKKEFHAAMLSVWMFINLVWWYGREKDWLTITLGVVMIVFMLRELVLFNKHKQHLRPSSASTD